MVESALVDSRCSVANSAAAWTTAGQAALSFTTSQSLFKLMSVMSVAVDSEFWQTTSC